MLNLRSYAPKDATLSKTQLQPNMPKHNSHLYLQIIDHFLQNWGIALRRKHHFKGIYLALCQLSLFVLIFIKDTALKGSCRVYIEKNVLSHILPARHKLTWKYPLFLTKEKRDFEFNQICLSTIPISFSKISKYQQCWTSQNSLILPKWGGKKRRQRKKERKSVIRAPNQTITRNRDH